MRIAVIGGGAVGMLFASFLSNTNKVTIFTRKKEQSVQLSEHGLTYASNGVVTTHHEIQVSTIAEFETTMFDLAIICVKQYALSELLEQLKVDRELPLLFLQNGMGHLREINTLNVSTVLVGSVEHGALKRSPSMVEHTGIGLTRLASVRTAKSHQNLLSSIVSQWQAASFPLQIEKDYMRMLQDKLVVNAVVNPLTAVLGVKNGDLLRNPYYYQLFLQLIIEVTEVLGFDVATYTQHIENICQRTANNESSMYKDVKERRKTEIDAITGYIINLAKNQDMDVPFCQLLYQWIKGMEYEGVS